MASDSQSPEQAAKLNRSGIISQGSTIDVSVSTDGHDIELKPDNLAVRRPLDLKIGEHDLLMAQLVEEPEQPTFSHPVTGKVQTSPSRMMQIQSRNSNREALVWIEYQPGMQLAALDMPEGANGRVWVLQDTMETEYSCRLCKGRGYFEDENCEVCGGESKRDGGDCPACKVLGMGFRDKWSCGRRSCHSCRGSGWRAGIVIPETAQSIPVSGVIVSVGPNTSVVKLGDRILHSSYAGHRIQAPGGKVLTVMRESEILSLIRER